MEEEYSVTIQNLDKTGFRRKETWRMDGQIHRSDGPAVTIFAARNGKVSEEKYYDHGIAGRKNGPAEIGYGGSGRVISKSWYLNGEDNDHRINGPSYVEFDETNGRVCHATWCRNGKLFRENGPAVINRDTETGVIYYEAWIVNNQYHRSGGKPAIIYRDSETGETTSALYYKNGVEIPAPTADTPLTTFI